MSGGFDGEMLERGHEGYERARRAAVWNGRTPERYPQLIVRAAGEADVVRAVLMAGELDMRIAVRSGGHSWAGNHLRDGGMLIDLSSMNRLTVDAAGMSATARGTRSPIAPTPGRRPPGRAPSCTGVRCTVPSRSSGTRSRNPALCDARARPALRRGVLPPRGGAA
jgi:hypothetical protein